MGRYILWLDETGMQDVDQVGGKNASPGEMIQNLSRLGVQVPGGFATTAEAYREFPAAEGLDGRISKALAGLDVDDVRALAETGGQIRRWIMETPFPAALDQAINGAYTRLEQGITSTSLNPDSVIDTWLFMAGRDNR